MTFHSKAFENFLKLDVLNKWIEHVLTLPEDKPVLCITRDKSINFALCYANCEQNEIQILVPATQNGFSFSAFHGEMWSM